MLKEETLKEKSSEEDSHISVTQLNMYLRCPAQYYFRYIEGIILPPKSAFTKGRTVHRAIAANYKQKIDTYQDMPAGKLQEITAAIFEEEAKDTDWEKNENPGQVKDETIALATLYHQTVAPTVQPVYVEQKVLVSIPGCPDLLGFIDLVDDKEFIRDTKTAKRSPGKDIAEKSLQLTAYSLAYRKLTGKQEAGVKLDYLIETKKPKAETIESQRTEADLNRFILICRAIWNAIENEIFYPNPDNFLCSPQWCGYWDMCHKLY